MRVVMLLMGEVSNDARVIREASALAAHGHRTTVVCLAGPDLPEEEEKDGFAIRRVATPAAVEPWQVIQKIRRQRQRNAALIEACLAARPHVVHAHDTPTLPAAVRAARLAGCSVVCDAHELYPDSLEQQPVQGTWPVQAFWRHVERSNIPRVHEMITVCDGLRDVLELRFGVAATVVANTPPLEPVADRGLLRRRLGIPDSVPLILYQGGLYVGRSLRPLVDAMAEVPDAVLVVQGSGPAERSMREHARQRRIQERVIFMGQVPQTELFALTCGADVGTAFLDGVTLNHKLAWPNRLFMYFMAGIPSAVSDLPGMSGLVDQYGVGLKARVGDSRSIGAALAQLIEDSKTSADMGARARRLAEERFNWETESQKLLGVYERIESKCERDDAFAVHKSR